jgi:GNAT superfamily N-acetyltransferase
VTLWVADLAAPPPPAPPPVTGAEIREVRSGNRAALEAPLRGDVALPRFDRGCRCFTAWVGEQLGAFCWVSTGHEWIGEIERELFLPEGDAYIWNCVTMPQHRRSGLFRVLVAEAVAATRREGFAHAWIGCVPQASWTAATLRGSGFIPAARVGLAGVRGLGLSLVHLTPLDEADPALVSSVKSALALSGWSIQRRRALVH